MSGVGSTNAMKKGSANNPFLAYSEADMQGFLNSAYTGCIVKYTGPAINRALSEQNKTVPDYAQNLVFNRDNYGWPSFYNGNIKFIITEKTNEGTNTWYLAAGKYVNGAWDFSREGAVNGDVVLTNSLGANPTSIRKLRTLKDKWNNDYINDQGNLTFWTYDEDVVFTIAPIDNYDIDYTDIIGITIVPYKVNELYKVVYGDGKYYYEEFCHISDTRTTANSDYIAPGKTAFDFTGNLQTGNGSKINPYLAYTVAELQSFPVGSFIKWLGPNKTVLDETTGQVLIHGEVYRAVEDGDILQYAILPTLSNPGTAADLAQGKQLIDGEGKVVEGTAESAEGKLAVELFAKTITDINDVVGSVTAWPAMYSMERAAFCSNCVNLSRVNLPNIASRSISNNIPYSAFYNCKALEYVDVGYITAINDFAFEGCKNLKELKFLDNVVSLGNSVFRNASFLSKPYFSKLSSINNYYTFADAYLCDLDDSVFPKLTNISGFNVFSYCENITKIDLPKLSRIAGYNIFGHTSVSQFNAPALTFLGASSCFNATPLNEINTPVLTYIGGSVFVGCRHLEKVTFPKVSYCGSYAFSGCLKLHTIIFKDVVSIYNSAFCDCTSLSSVYLLGSSVGSLGNSNAFSRTHIMSSLVSTPYGWGSIFVPMSLLSEYKTTNVWSAFSNRLVGLTDEEIALIE